MMVAAPLNWISWREARDLMPKKIWAEWRYRSDHADQAFIRCLRRGNVPYRGEASEHLPYFIRHPVPLGDVVTGLLSLRTQYMSVFAYEAEYEAPQWQPIWTLDDLRRPPITVKRTVILNNVELSWDDFRNDLIRYELPRGAEPITSPGEKNRPNPSERRLKPAPEVAIHKAIRTIYDEAEAAKAKAPNIVEIVRPVRTRLQAGGLKASGRQIQRLAGADRYKRRRRKTGLTLINKKKS